MSKMIQRLQGIISQHTDGIPEKRRTYPSKTLNTSHTAQKGEQTGLDARYPVPSNRTYAMPGKGHPLTWPKE
jgi:hypothetical protein